MNMLRAKTHRLRKAGNRFRNFLLNDDRGVSAIEFAVVAPVFAFILAASLDLSMLLYTRFQMDTAVSNGASYALINSNMVTSERGADLAADIAGLISSTGAKEGAKARIVVNNGPDAQYEGATVRTSGEGRNADRCYCPTGNPKALSWGASQNCGARCPNGAPAGKFVTISVEQPYKPVFSGYGTVQDDAITAAAVVRTQ